MTAVSAAFIDGGRIARSSSGSDAERLLRHAAHGAFDRLWADTSRDLEAGARNSPRRDKARRRLWDARRTCAYAWLAHQLGLPRARCHFGLFDAAQLERVLAVCRAADPAAVRAFKVEDEPRRTQRTQSKSRSSSSVPEPAPAKAGVVKS